MGECSHSRQCLLTLVHGIDPLLVFNVRTFISPVSTPLCFDWRLNEDPYWTVYLVESINVCEGHDMCGSNDLLQLCTAERGWA